MTGQASAYCRAILAAALCAGAVGVALPADAAPGSLREGLFRKRPSEGRQFTAPPVARYVAEDGRSFILDRTQPRPLLRFEGSSEIWALHPQPAPRGDVIYKNDVGEPVLRATRLGGVTVFTPDRPEGAAAAPTGNGAPIRLPPIGPQTLGERLLQASARASRAARRLIPFEAEATPASSALLADAAMVTSEAMTRMGRQPRMRGFLNRIMKVRLTEGRRPAAAMENGTLMITVAPQQGLAGRPSSERIVRVAQTP
ncbi:DUF4908 domain-containing protein [Phenylobacterium sp.]|uniref:DUF4908 domain-containing protein n=1 Tax=Phenylobacterium sp. TaxID=1871053 RepID=UPI002F938232